MCSNNETLAIVSNCTSLTGKKKKKRNHKKSCSHAIIGLLNQYTGSVQLLVMIVKLFHTISSYVVLLIFHLQWMMGVMEGIVLGAG